MTLVLISAADRLAEPRGVKALIVGPVAVGKTSLLRTVDPRRTLFIDIEAGDLSVQDVCVDTIRLNDWPSARDLAVRVGGPDAAGPPSQCYSHAHFEAVGGFLENLDRYDTIFIDSLTAISRLAFAWAEQQPEAFSERTGKKDTRGAYGLLAREMITWLNRLQRARKKNVIFVGILELNIDEFNRAEWRLQCEGSKTSRELPGIVDQIITMQFVDFGDEAAPARAFVCTSPNSWQYPAKDRSGRLEQIEPPDLGKLIAKLISKREIKIAVQ